MFVSVFVFFLMIRRPPRSTRTYTLFPYTTLFRSTDQTSILDTGLVLRAIGYRGTPMPGLPFDDVRGVIRNQQGRVIDDAGHVLRGVYTSGWIKRGCRGIIGSNRKCARETVAQQIGRAHV